jgi:hypothetical protein
MNLCLCILNGLWFQILGLICYVFRCRFILEIIIVAILTTKIATIITTKFSFGVLWNCPNFHYFDVHTRPTANDMKYGRNKRRNKSTYRRAVWTLLPRLLLWLCLFQSSLCVFHTYFFLPSFISFLHFVFFLSPNLRLYCFYQSDIFVTFYSVYISFPYYNLFKIVKFCCIFPFIAWFLCTVILNLL